jgi:DNA-binding XRE family transcriptional regulator
MFYWYDTVSGSRTTALILISGGPIVIVEEGFPNMAQRSQASVALGLAVRDLRRGARISQEELGFRSGMHRTYVGGIERGERNPSWMNIVKLADALAAKPSELIARAEQHGWISSEDRV